MKSLFFWTTLVLVGAGAAFAGMAEPRSLDAVVADIEQQQNVKALGDVNVDKVKPDLLEELGDAVMDVIIGNAAMHDRMDRMIGGDGSPQLNAFHTDLAVQYLKNGGIQGVRMGGMWGPGRFGMMHGWGNTSGWANGQALSVDGKLAFVNGVPAVKTTAKTYLLDFPDFYYYAYTNALKADDAIHVDGFVFGTNDPSPLLSVSKAKVGGKTFDFLGSTTLRGYGMTGGRGMMGGGMMGW